MMEIIKSNEETINFNELCKQAIKDVFYNEIYSIIYSDELTTNSITTESVEKLQNLHQKWVNLHNLSDGMFQNHETGFKIEPVTRIVDVTDDASADLPYQCSHCSSNLFEFTRYCPDCGYRNIDYKEEEK